MVFKSGRTCLLSSFFEQNDPQTCNSKKTNGKKIMFDKIPSMENLFGQNHVIRVEHYSQDVRNGKKAFHHTCFFYTIDQSLNWCGSVDLEDEC